VRNLNKTTYFVPQLFKILRSSNRATALTIENFHGRLKILGWPTKRQGFFSGSKLHADSKTAWLVCLELNFDR
jgi:hypothetical protein